MKVIDRINQVMDNAGVPARSRKKELSRVSGVSYESVRKWFNGTTTSIETDHLTKIAKHYKVSLDWLASGKERSQPMETGKQVPLLKKADLDEFLSGTLTSTSTAGEKSSLIRDSVDAGAKTFAYIETSDGMSPRIEPGDTVYIDPESTDLSPGREIYLVKTAGGYMLGSAKETPRGLMLYFDNPSPGWEPVPVEKSDCRGKVVAFVPSWLGN